MSELLYSSHRLSHLYFFLLLIIFSIYNNVLFSEPLWWIRLIYNNARMLLKLEWAFSFFSAMSIAESSKDPGYGEDPGLGSNSGTMMSQSSSTSFSRTNSHHSHASSSASNTSSKASSQHHGFNQQRTQLWILLQIVSFCFFLFCLSQWMLSRFYEGNIFWQAVESRENVTLPPLRLSTHKLLANNLKKKKKSNENLNISLMGKKTLSSLFRTLVESATLPALFACLEECPENN